MNEPPRVLYIDGNEGLHHLTVRALAKRGFAMRAAATGTEGVALARSESFDVIAIDHCRPGQDGLETLRLLTENDGAVPPPIVYVTGSDQSRIAVAALKAGASDCLVKSVGDAFFDLLATAFHQALERERLKRERFEAENALRKTNRHLEALLKETNHRVANSLQMVSAFVILQSNAVPDETAKAALKQTQKRILAIARVHRKLSTSDSVETVDMADYLSTLLSDLEETWSTPLSSRHLSLSADDVTLNADKAVAVGVVVTELVSNACRYAYAPGHSGEVRVRLHRDADQSFLLEVEDDGPGFDADGAALGTGLGGRIVGAMAANMRGRIDYVRDASGFRISLRAAL